LTCLTAKAGLSNTGGDISAFKSLIDNPVGNKKAFDKSNAYIKAGYYKN
jgi:hypothetical protein